MVNSPGTPSDLLVAALLVASALLACNRASGSAPPAPSEHGGAQVRDDVHGVAKATEKAARDLGRATVDLADKAGDGLKDATNKAGVRGDDAWLTTKVKAALASDGFDPLGVHVDTADKIVTLSGTVDTAAKRQKATDAAKAVAGVARVDDHLFVKK